MSATMLPPLRVASATRPIYPRRRGRGSGENWSDPGENWSHRPAPMEFTVGGVGLRQIPAEALDAFARLLQVLGLCRIGNAERRTDAEGRTLHHRDAFGLE